MPLTLRARCVFYYLYINLYKLNNFNHMALIERIPETTPNSSRQFNAYALRPDQPCVLRTAKLLTESELPYIDKVSHPDIIEMGVDLAVYKFDGLHPAAEISRSIEGTVMSDDWHQSPDESMLDAQEYEANSLFFLVLDISDPSAPKPAASLRVANCLTGPSETVQYYQKISGETELLPRELNVLEEDKTRGLWDVVGVMADKAYRGGNVTAWAYHALYKASQEHGVHRWISNITDKEFKNLNSLGIPFRLIDGTMKVEMPREGRSPITFGFYTIDVDDIRPNMTSVIGQLESATEHIDFYRLLAKLSRIAMDGSYSADQSIARKI